MKCENDGKSMMEMYDNDYMGGLYYFKYFKCIVAESEYPMILSTIYQVGKEDQYEDRSYL